MRRSLVAVAREHTKQGFGVRLLTKPTGRFPSEIVVMFTPATGRNQHADAQALVKALRATLGEAVHVKSHTDLLVRVAGAMAVPALNSMRAWQNLALLSETSCLNYLSRYTSRDGIQTRVLLRTRGPLKEANWKAFEQQL